MASYTSHLHVIQDRLKQGESWLKLQKNQLASWRPSRLQRSGVTLNNLEIAVTALSAVTALRARLVAILHSAARICIQGKSWLLMSRKL